jgi:DNA-binding LacI/PurR family transcriptional regulator
VEIGRALYSTSRDRARGVFEVLGRLGIDSAEIPTYETRGSVASVHRGLAFLFDRAEPPTALFCMSDRIGMLALGWLAARGLDVPGEISVIGFDGVPEAATCDPPLTTIAQPIAEIGRRAVARILSPESVARRETLPLELVVRASTGPVYGESQRTMK